MFDTKLFASRLSGITPYNVDTQKYKVRLDANESFIQVPEKLREKLKNALSDFEFNRYPDPDASALTSAFCKYYGLSGDCVAVGNGSDEIISILMNCFADFGSAVMVFDADFSMYAFYASLAGCRVIKCPKSADLQIDFDLAQKTIKQNGIRLCIFSNPCNPTGKIESKADITRLAQSCPETLFVSDEAYMDFSKKDESFLSETEKYPNIIVLKTMSKALGCASLRLGFIISDDTFTRMFKAAKSPYNVNGISQKFGEIVFSEKQLLRQSTSDIINSTENLEKGIADINIFKTDDTYTNFVFAQNPRVKEIFENLKQKSILVRYFDIQGGSLRICAGTDEENRTLINALKEEAAKQ